MLKRIMLLTAVSTAILTPAATAGHRDAILLPTQRLEILAYDLTDASVAMRAEAAQRLHGRRPGNDRAMDALDDLAIRAARFEKNVRRNASPARLNLSFDLLFDSYERAERAMRRVPNGRLQREFRSVENAMFRLTRGMEVARVPARRAPRRADGLHGSIVYGDRIGDARVSVRIGF